MKKMILAATLFAFAGIGYQPLNAAAHKKTFGQVEADIKQQLSLDNIYDDDAEGVYTFSCMINEFLNKGNSQQCYNSLTQIINNNDLNAEMITSLFIALFDYHFVDNALNDNDVSSLVHLLTAFNKYDYCRFADTCARLSVILSGFVEKERNQDRTLLLIDKPENCVVMLKLMKWSLRMWEQSDAKPQRNEIQSLSDISSAVVKYFRDKKAADIAYKQLTQKYTQKDTNPAKGKHKKKKKSAPVNQADCDEKEDDHTPHQAPTLSKQAQKRLNRENTQAAQQQAKARQENHQRALEQKAELERKIAQAQQKAAHKITNQVFKEASQELAAEYKEAEIRAIATVAADFTSQVFAGVFQQQEEKEAEILKTVNDFTDEIYAEVFTQANQMEEKNIDQLAHEMEFLDLNRGAAPDEKEETYFENANDQPSYERLVITAAIGKKEQDLKKLIAYLTPQSDDGQVSHPIPRNHPSFMLNKPLNQAGDRALHYAIATGNFSLARLLISTFKGIINPLIKNNAGKTPGDFLIYYMKIHPHIFRPFGDSIITYSSIPFSGVILDFEAIKEQLQDTWCRLDCDELSQIVCDALFLLEKLCTPSAVMKPQGFIGNSGVSSYSIFDILKAFLKTDASVDANL